MIRAYGEMVDVLWKGGTQSLPSASRPCGISWRRATLSRCSADIRWANFYKDAAHQEICGLHTHASSGEGADSARHEFYTHVEPDDGGKNPPPWWLIGILARIVSSLRRKLKLSARAIEAGWLDTVPAEWAAHQRPQLRTEIEKFSTIDLTTLDDAALFAHLDELRAFCARCMRLHFTLVVPHAVGLHELVTTCEELLGWDMQKTMHLFQGLSTTSAASTHELAEVARLVRNRAAAREIVEARRPDLVERLDEVDPSIADRLRQYLRVWGLRVFGSDAGSPSIAERPQFLADLLADLLTDDAPSDQSAARFAAVEEARSQLTEPARRRFDEALEYAERVYPLREDNVLLTDQLPTGLVRRVAIEAGRRLATKGLLTRADDAVMLTAEELRNALGAGRDVRRLISQRKSEHAWVRANPGPMTYGPEPGKMPDVRGLPGPARRINGALLWMMEQELSPPPKGDANTVTGIAVSPGVYRGRVRVIRSAAELSRVRAGDVLVCPTTSAAWTMVFQRAGALVTDAGSVLSHTAIVAREFGLPAVVATANATSVLKDGEEVIVDGTRAPATMRREDDRRVGLIFFVPGKGETLRISGSAKIVRDADLRESMAARGKTPDFALVLEVEEAFFHCSKCVIRSNLWTPQGWPALDGLPSLAQTMVDAAALPMPV